MRLPTTRWREGGERANPPSDRFRWGAGIRHDTAGTVPAVRYLADFERPGGDPLHQRHLVIWRTDFPEPCVTGSCARSMTSLARTRRKDDIRSIALTIF